MTRAAAAACSFPATMNATIGEQIGHDEQEHRAASTLAIH